VGQLGRFQDWLHFIYSRVFGRLSAQRVQCQGTMIIFAPQYQRARFYLCSHSTANAPDKRGGAAKRQYAKFTKISGKSGTIKNENVLPGQ
ncbi:MAG: hypothetical protein WCB93_09055, partial [Gallionella sp.]